MAVLASLQAFAYNLVRAIGSPEQLAITNRRSRLGAQPVEVRDIIERALHEAQHHLADTEAVLNTAIQRRVLSADRLLYAAGGSPSGSPARALR